MLITSSLLLGRKIFICNLLAIVNLWCQFVSAAERKQLWEERLHLQIWRPYNGKTERYSKAQSEQAAPAVSDRASIPYPQKMTPAHQSTALMAKVPEILGEGWGMVGLDDVCFQTFCDEVNPFYQITGCGLAHSLW